MHNYTLITHMYADDRTLSKRFVWTESSRITCKYTCNECISPMSFKVYLFPYSVEDMYDCINFILKVFRDLEFFIFFWGGLFQRDAPINDRLDWQITSALLARVVRMDDGRIPKDLLFGELATGKRPTGGPALSYKDVCKRDLKVGHFHPETTAVDRKCWWAKTKEIAKAGEEARQKRWQKKRLRRRVCLGGFFG